MVLNEPPRDMSELVEDLDVKHFSCPQSSNLLIVTNMEAWSIWWTVPEYECLILRNNFEEAFFLVGLYLNPILTLGEVKDMMRAVHEKMKIIKSNRFLILGDLNARAPLWSREEADRKGTVIMDTFIHIKAISAIDPVPETAKVNPVTGLCTWVDAILCDTTTKRKLIRRPRGYHIASSDHPMLSVDLQARITPKTKLNNRLLKENSKKADLAFLKNPWSTVEEAEHRCNQLDEILNLIGIHSRWTNNKRNKIIIPDKFWQASRKLRHSLNKHRRFQGRKPSEEIHRMICAEEKSLKALHHAIKKFKIRVRQNRMSNFEEKFGEWQAIKKVVGLQFFKKITRIDESKVNQSQLQNANKFKELFDKNEPVTMITKTRKRRVINFPDDLLEKVTAKIKSKPCLYDHEISCTVLGALLVEQGELILEFVKECLQRGFTPPNIKRSKIILIPKACGLKLRPLSIMHPLYRLFDAVLYTMVKNTASTEHLRFQYGFLEAKNAFHLFLDMKKHLESLKNQYPAVIISLDLSDAFENVGETAMRIGLRRAKINTHMTELIIQHIKNRSSFIESNGVKRWRHHVKGTPQGGFISPLLFSLATTILECVDTATFRIFAFADDINIVAVDDSCEPYREWWTKTQDRLSIVRDCLNIAELSLNPDKTKIMMIRNGGRRFTLDHRKLKVLDKMIKIDTTVNFLGIDFATRPHIYAMSTKNPDVIVFNAMDLALKKKEQLMILYASRFQSLRLRWYRTIIMAILGGSCNYFGLIMRIFTPWPEFVEHCEAAMRTIGRVIIRTLDLKRTLSLHLCYYLVFKEHLAIILEKLFTKKLLDMNKINNQSWFPKTYPPLSVYGVSIEKNLPCWNKDNFEFPKPCWRSEGEPNVRYWKRKTDIDLWFKVEITTDKKEVEFYRYWAPGQHYLEDLCDALTNAIEPRIKSLRGGRLIIESDKGLGQRLIKPGSWNRLIAMISDLKVVTILRARESQRFEVTRNLRTEIPRRVIYPNSGFFRLLNIMTHLKCSKKKDLNLAEQALHLNGFQAVNWSVLARTDIRNISYLAGAWRSSEHNRIYCKICDKSFRTREALISPCLHATPLTINGKPANEQSLLKGFSSLNRIASVSLCLYRIIQALNK